MSIQIHIPILPDCFKQSFGYVSIFTLLKTDYNSSHNFSYTNYTQPVSKWHYFKNFFIRTIFFHFQRVFGGFNSFIPKRKKWNFKFPKQIINYSLGFHTFFIRTIFFHFQRLFGGFNCSSIFSFKKPNFFTVYCQYGGL